MTEKVIGPEAGANANANANANAYDRVPYAVYTFAYTHPDQLSTVAMMCGMKPAAVERCRVLEMGCASGGNLIPMAEALKQSEFVGVDYSAKQIEAGNSMVAELGLENIQLLQKDLREVGKELGEFDYVVAHGVYSWVPQEVRDKVLGICRDCLAPNGVAYVSYNTFPGWGMRTMIRDMMRYHIRDIEEPTEQVAQARALLNFLVESVPETNKHYAGLLKEELELIRNAKDSYLFHDHLEEVNEPVYFHQFIEHAGRHGLQFLAEADPRSALGRDLKPEVREKVRPLGGIIEREQYLDFLRYRGFRQTLLCHKNVELKRKFDPNLMRGLSVSSSAKTVEGSDPKAEAGPWRFVDNKGRDVSTTNRLVRDLLVWLINANPRRIPFEQLVDQATMEGAAEQAMTRVAEVLFELYMTSLVKFHSRAIDFAPAVSERPTARRLARLQAQKTDRAANYLHEAVNLMPMARKLLPLLDGTRTREQLVDEFERMLERGELSEIQELRDLPAENRRQVIAQQIEQTLQRAVNAALLAA